MTSIQVVAVHDIVDHLFPRPDREEDFLGRAEGLAVDRALSDFGHRVRLGQRPTVTSIVIPAVAVARDSLEGAGGEPTEPWLSIVSGQVQEVLKAYRKTDLAGLPRPRSRLVLVGGRCGFYAQPDFWDGRARVYEVKSFLADLTRPEIRLQVDLFQLAFPKFILELVSFDRRAVPVTVRREVVPPISQERIVELLRAAEECAKLKGQERVLEYAEVTIIPYAADGSPL